MKMPVLLSFAWCAMLTLLGQNAVIMFMTWVVMCMVSNIGYRLGMGE